MFIFIYRFIFIEMVICTYKKPEIQRDSTVQQFLLHLGKAKMDPKADSQEREC